ncbi:PIN domain-containing protein [Xanthobacter sediminis]|uniref:PIN domain-containing protein n=1 Tax=Xanthobacter sediminis TaxID=3119926 RepID=UPI00372812D4
MFIDASAIVSILTFEDDHEILLRRLEASQTPRYVSPLAVFEAVAAIARKSALLASSPVTPQIVEAAQELVADFVKSVDAKEIMVSAEIGRKAVVEMMEHGKLIGAHAQLNFGDCFASACAKAYRVPRLYNVNEFTHTAFA